MIEEFPILIPGSNHSTKRIGLRAQARAMNVCVSVPDVWILPRMCAIMCAPLKRSEEQLQRIRMRMEAIAAVAKDTLHVNRMADMDIEKGYSCDEEEKRFQLN
ncbi:hypothetical protein CAEBREN_05146 [Caenorhabditis brenneri]|uniref:Uncharacterized protein n=1 Tax=Caenorhabditis brenneri TaxID=135651 RepID=G0MXJ7_CAEBE|nr:hypothetical protein CAEBREN_05146 [Caenorhabditis brenneri]